MNEPLLHKFETTQAFGKSSLKTVIEHMSEIARRQDEWLRDELRITGATA